MPMQFSTGIRLSLLILGLACTTPALQVKYDVVGPIGPWWRSQIVQVDQDFDWWGVAVAPEWIQREYHWDSQTKSDTISTMTANGGGLWVSAFVRPFRRENLHVIKLGAYGRVRKFEYSYTDRWYDDIHFRQSIASWAIGGEASLNFKLMNHVFAEPYVRWGLAHYDMRWKGHAPQYPYPSEFRHEWGPDFRSGVFAGWEF